MKEENKMKKVIYVLVVLLFSLVVISAHDDRNFTQAETLIQQKVSCDKLTEEQLELIGDYYMEQMHPGEAHKLMDQMMGGEGSESLKAMHIAMALRIYCGENIDYRTMSEYGMHYRMMPMMTGYKDTSYGYNWQNWIMLLAFVLIIVLLVILIIKQTQKR
ncbi:MAG: hypothetical protein KatS3mg001_023 [Candidatus Pacearchaeota archaeon]|nr:MAG: hypothetical protein KatS3mg001_023 [Candidatus Pacearchaeota archaeon]